MARFWCRGDVDPAHAPFTGVTRERVLDSVTLFHRLEAESAAWARGAGGSVIELHSYACPHDASLDDLVAAMRASSTALWPEFADLEVLDVDAHRYTNAPGFDPGYHPRRPGVVTDARGLRLAGTGWPRHPLGAHGAGRAHRGAGGERRAARGGRRPGAGALDRAAGCPRGTHPAVIIPGR